MNYRCNRRARRAYAKGMLIAASWYAFQHIQRLVPRHARLKRSKLCDMADGIRNSMENAWTR